MPEITPTALLRLPETFARLPNERRQIEAPSGRYDNSPGHRRVFEPTPWVTPPQIFLPLPAGRGWGGRGLTRPELNMATSTQAQRPGARDATIAIPIPNRDSLQRMVSRFHHHLHPSSTVPNHPLDAEVYPQATLRSGRV